MASGAAYVETLAEAQRRGLAEPDPSADVDGLDAASKLMVLSALVLGEPLALDAVELRGVSALEPGEVERATAAGRVVREVATLERSEAGGPVARVAVEELDPSDPLAAAKETDNAIVCEAEPLGRIAISGPGAGPQLAGQGALADLLGVAEELTRAQSRARS
jgi:homoserine dehydrogenase